MGLWVVPGVDCDVLSLPVSPTFPPAETMQTPLGSPVSGAESGPLRAEEVAKALARRLLSKEVVTPGRRDGFPAES